jgi:hypothetical protein
MASDRHYTDDDEEDFWNTPSSLMRESSPRELAAPRRCACSVIDHDADPWEFDATFIPGLRNGAAVGSWRANITDALFFSLMGAIVGYVMLLASGMLYRGKPDIADAMRWRLWRDGRVALVDGPGQKRRGYGGNPIACLPPTSGRSVTSVSQTIRTACSTSA